MREHAIAAASLGWRTVELWGVHPGAPAVRIDAMGALMFGARVANVLASELVYVDGPVYRRRPRVPAVGDSCRGRSADLGAIKTAGSSARRSVPAFLRSEHFRMGIVHGSAPFQLGSRCRLGLRSGSG
jgi:hypothetical protein